MTAQRFNPWKLSFSMAACDGSPRFYEFTFNLPIGRNLEDGFRLTR